MLPIMAFRSGSIFNRNVALRPMDFNLPTINFYPAFHLRPQVQK